MILVEQQIESGVRAEIRKALTAAQDETPELADVRIVGFWLGPEDDRDDGDAEGNRVELKAAPSSSAGYQPGIGFMPQRSVTVEVDCYVQPDDDRRRIVLAALYKAVRGVFEAAPFAASLGSGVTFGGLLITAGGAADMGEAGMVCGFSVEFHVTVTG